jgi:hypothetical protein
VSAAKLLPENEHRDTEHREHQMEDADGIHHHLTRPSLHPLEARRSPAGDSFPLPWFSGSRPLPLPRRREPAEPFVDRRSRLGQCNG